MYSYHGPIVSFPDQDREAIEKNKLLDEQNRQLAEQNKQLAEQNKNLQRLADAASKSAVSANKSAKSSQLVAWLMFGITALSVLADIAIALLSYFN